MKTKPLLRTAAIWNMSFGFLGIQAGFALQNANASRILQIFGADTHHLGWFWLVAPITGMIVQPIIGHMSDQTWSSLGRRKPYFLIGAILASIGLILIPNAGLFTAFIPALWVGAGMLMLMDASFNVAMEPFRALVADKLSTDQRTAGFAIQTVLIGIGAVIGSWLPTIMADWIGLEATSPSGGVPQSLIYAFVAVAAILLGSIIWTIVTTKEYSPEEMAAFEDSQEEQEDEKSSMSAAILKNIAHMPAAMKQLGIVQFCSWFALFGMWTYTTPAVAEHIYGLQPNDTTSPDYQTAGNMVGYIFGIYNMIAAVYAFILPWIAGKIGRKYAHGVSLFFGGIGLLSIFIIDNPDYLVYPMIGVGMAWASILAMPYAMLAGSIPAKKMGIYMGIFNLFITVPQIINGIIGGPLLANLYNHHAIYAIVASGIFLVGGAVASCFMKDPDDKVLQKVN